MRAIAIFERLYLPSEEHIALIARREFLRAFPIDSLSKMSMDDYVQGKGSKDSFCYLLEVATQSWAQIVGSTARKFGIYYGKTSGHPERTYRYNTVLRGKNAQEAFRNLKVILTTLLKLGAAKRLDFAAIDKLPLAQTVKGKILSLYLPHRFINICSAEHLELFGIELGMESGLYTSQYQHEIVRVKNANARTKAWSNPKFMEYLYASYYPDQTSDKAQEHDGTAKVIAPKEKKHPVVNFEEIHAARREFGEKAEAFAMAWEKKRIRRQGLMELVPPPVDVHDRPSLGYDIRSHSAKGVERYIEVKTVRHVRGGLRFFLSSHEKKVSDDSKHLAEYYFYLVHFEGKKPVRLDSVRAAECYEKSDLTPAAYAVWFDLRRH